MDARGALRLSPPGRGRAIRRHRALRSVSAHPFRRPLTGRSRRAPAARKLSLVLLFTAAQVLFLFSPLFRLEVVEVSGNRRIGSERILRQAALPPGPYLWSLSARRIADRVEALPGVREATVRFRLPGRVEIRVVEREPVILVGQRSAVPLWFEADAEGVILGPAPRGSPLPRLMVEDPVGAAGRLEPTPIRTVLQAHFWVEGKLPAPAAFYQVDPVGSVTVWTRYGTEPLCICVGPVENMDYKMHVLKAILESMDREGRRVASVDLRFPMPVVRPLLPPSPPPGS